MRMEMAAIYHSQVSLIVITYPRRETLNKARPQHQNRQPASCDCGTKKRLLSESSGYTYADVLLDSGLVLSSIRKLCTNLNLVTLMCAKALISKNNRQILPLDCPIRSPSNRFLRLQSLAVPKYWTDVIKKLEVIPQGVTGLEVGSKLNLLNSTTTQVII